MSRGGQDSLRVLHVTAVETSNYYLNNLAPLISEEGVELLAVTLSRAGTFVPALEAVGARAWALNAVSRQAYARAAIHLWRLVHKERVDLLHLHLFEPTVLGALVARASKRPVVITRHHSDAVHRLPAGMKRSIYSKLERWVNHRAAHIIAPSRRVFEVLTRHEGVAESKVTVVPYGQSPERFDSVRATDPKAVRRSLGVGSPLVICVARLHPEKGHRYLLEAFARLKSQISNAMLMLVGTGPEGDVLIKLMGMLGLQSSVRLMGWRDDVLSLIWAADLLVHPSLHEALPSAVIEAIMLGVPVVATDVSGVRDILGDNEYGTVVLPADADMLYCAMRDALSDLSRARRRAEQGRIHVSRYMDAGSVARQHAACYRLVVAHCA